MTVDQLYALHMERLITMHRSVRTATDEELIAHGWGSTVRDRIPANWREVRGPDRWEQLTASRKKAAASRKARKSTDGGKVEENASRCAGA